MMIIIIDQNIHPVTWGFLIPAVFRQIENWNQKSGGTLSMALLEADLMNEYNLQVCLLRTQWRSQKHHENTNIIWPL